MRIYIQNPFKGPLITVSFDDADGAVLAFVPAAFSSAPADIAATAAAGAAAGGTASVGAVLTAIAVLFSGDSPFRPQFAGINRFAPRASGADVTYEPRATAVASAVDLPSEPTRSATTAAAPRRKRLTPEENISALIEAAKTGDAHALTDLKVRAYTHPEEFASHMDVLLEDIKTYPAMAEVVSILKNNLKDTHIPRLIELAKTNEIILTILVDMIELGAWYFSDAHIETLMHAVETHPHLAWVLAELAKVKRYHVPHIITRLIHLVSGDNDPAQALRELARTHESLFTETHLVGLIQISGKSRKIGSAIMALVEKRPDLFQSSHISAMIDTAKTNDRIGIALYNMIQSHPQLFTKPHVDAMTKLREDHVHIDHALQGLSHNRPDLFVK